jgi:hypothetical protein
MSLKHHGRCERFGHGDWRLMDSIGLWLVEVLSHLIEKIEQETGIEPATSGLGHGVKQMAVVKRSAWP